MRRAVIIGAGMAGMLSARAAADFVDEVLVVEADDLPDGPRPRKGLPQARHIHSLVAGGADAAQELLPGIVQHWLDAGAHRHELTAGMVALSPEGWYRRWQPDGHFIITASRDLLDWVVRKQVLADARIRLLGGRKVTALHGSARQITGVLHNPAHGPDDPQHLDANLVIDASGRASRATAWLAGLGIDTIPHRTLDTGLTYATRLFRAPAGAEHIPVFNIMAQPRAGIGQSAVLAPIENGQWMATLGGIKGSEPTRNADDFIAFALGLRHPLIGQLLHGLEHVSDVTLTRSTGNRRHYYEKSRAWPDGLIVLGDAIATFNPVYGQGMSVAALGARALHHELHKGGGLTAGLARRVQRAAATSVDAAWAPATAQDIHYTSAHGQKPSRPERLLGRFTSRLSYTATGSQFMADAVTDVTSMRAASTRLLDPAVLRAAAAGPKLQPLIGPPLTEPEQRLLTPLEEIKGKPA
ncbi:pyridine nucleotide-disulfide oxidoreductase [Streptomyces sp. NPDC047070]|uniref:NAD(P)/FAD-dependent oxidoreductase n=1 Tax=Streptomyces sp. NPDC047070 TaxID=3154923 RepID=UPI003455281A